MQSRGVSIRVSGFVLGAALALCLPPSTAHAQCDAGDGGTDPTLFGVLRDTFPADQGINVPTDGIVRLRYFGRVPDPPTVCVKPPNATDCLDGTASAVGDEVVWMVNSPTGLAAFTEYTVSFADASGGANRITFTTAGTRSPGPPSFGGIMNATAMSAATDPCDRAAVDITVRFNRADNASSLSSTSWPDSDLEYVIYETRGPGIAGPRERDRVRLQRSGSSTDTVAQRSFRLSGADGAGPVCFNIQVVDPTGRADGNAVEQCVNPAQGNYFAGCAVSPSKTSSHTGVFAVALFALGSLRRRNRRPS